MRVVFSSFSASGKRLEANRDAKICQATVHLPKVLYKASPNLDQTLKHVTHVSVSRSLSILVRQPAIFQASHCLTLPFPSTSSVIVRFFHNTTSGRLRPSCHGRVMPTFTLPSQPINHARYPVQWALLLPTCIFQLAIMNATSFPSLSASACSTEPSSKAVGFPSIFSTRSLAGSV